MNRALVTGADGFIGSHLVEELLQRGYFVTAIVQYNSFNSWGWLDHIENEKMLNIISGDIRDPHFCMNIIKDIDVIFHLAALIAIPYSYLAPDSYLDTNIKGTLNICQAAKQNGNIKVIHTSTSEVYGTALYVPIDEKHPKQPQSPYSASKIAADMIALSFYNSFGLPVVVARPFNTYGPRQSARAIIPTIITQIASGKKEIKVGDLSPTRDFNYVKDTVYGFIAIAESGDKSIGKEINISSNSEISMEDTFYLIKKIMKSEVIFVQDDQRLRPAKSEVFRLWGDNKLITDLTNYRQLFDIEKGLTKTIEWYMDKSNLSKFKTNMYNV
jgi:NAD dependent epimerase/dehydratase